ncbi:MAG: hypothetical protein A3A96_00515 [Candidatus Zambryskibacteria bacterium RIFCSPLOWO2_01_FULL_39_39]|uniref:Cohesin domain-containing protein n=1 Tax=Candidatus Zambryskibacteria bacterium RIFCSPLOWO2_01_FULL_39_39 TaxID=1802758 RepID=A0A1G2TXM3_9BACT|nr:MAG: hypothetical protein UT00_C0001G0003 [Parcubacteria group bacterium GW2011_GWA1_38_7]OHA87809.1 MAG: hypothetical protein A2644_01380 [Candidatus Zambryskibacteria bacterium RIFCSPHIGHO2_01_FULL_39_63]OHA94966.1 MAG: hypothetical protein A3B88_01135 [Candidatus Zambryskibacteria bacterium RIFCSPHIGHO2_02_FULL_39_19]OHA99147.1 MAG: hypothetical protein A3F20_03085 [Candidatus Zambryskibacteria bacterium RIFCSPHIGHO2_12_FULL_39_21]OHB01909.1 MAG: hypothetical protein A3A96_00515 [Candidat
MTLIKKYTTISFFCSLFLVFFVVPNSLQAESVSLSSTKTSYAVGDSILVTASVQTGGQQINTAEGQVNFPPNLMSVSDVRYGNSIISLWVLKPSANNSLGEINFTGGVPGGFSGNTGNLFTFIVKPKKEGVLTINLKDVHILLNDGSGGELLGLKMIPLTLNITAAKTVTEVPAKDTPVEIAEGSIISPDKVPPENFAPMVSHHDSIANDSYFVAFSAVDKDSGVSKYEVREVPKIIGLLTDRFSTPWVEAKSPYVLSFQSWGSLVEVRAIDGANNSTISSANKPFGTTITIIFVIILILFSVMLTCKFTKNSYTHIK